LRVVIAIIFLAAGMAMPAAAFSQTTTLCTLILDGDTGVALIEAGDCTTPVTPASTFKVPLALIGFDSGVLIDPHTPALAFQPGDPDWVEDWRHDTDPERWMAYSVLWYSQRIAHALGAEALAAYATAFGYGNGDFSGDPGMNNGLDRAWVSSSLKISPRNQAQFLLDLLHRDLPVSAAAYDNTFAIIEAFPAGEGWTLNGKTGSAYPRNVDMSFDYARGWGWFIGWAERDEERYVFVRLNQDEARVAGSGGVRARDALIAEWPAIAASLP
jgi:beta-lactamase class D